ncbi:MAG: transcription initiation factor IIB family protein [Candidatus Odinarchaeota archaeon]
MVYTRVKNYDKNVIRENGERCCSFPNITTCHGYNVCTNCGEVHSRVISYKLKTKYFLNDKIDFGNVEPVRSPFGPRTVINGNRDGKGNCLSPKALHNFERLARINRGLVSGFERNLWIALPKFDQIKAQLNLPNYVAEDAFRIYVSAAKSKLTLGRSIDGILTVSVYFALKLNEITRSIEEILSVFQISRKKFMNCYKIIFNKIISKLNLKISNFTPQHYIDRFFDELNLSMNCRNSAIKVFEDSKKKGLIISGKDPKGIAAASLYITSKKYDEFRTQKQICKIANVSAITLRMRVKEISSYI